MVRWTSALSLMALVWCVVPDAGLARPPVGMSELARAKAMLDLYRAQLSADQYALLSSRLAHTEQAYVALTALTEVGGGAAMVATESGAVVSTGSRALLSGVAELLPLLLFVWPSTACAPEEKPEVREARLTLKQRVEDLTQAVRQVEEERAAAPAPESTDVMDTGCGTSHDPNDDDQSKCTGQDHHIISKAVWRVLDRHLVLKGLYQYRDPHFVAQAKDLKAHCGFQNWHRKLDEEIATWLEKYNKATAQEFEAYLRDVYRRPDLCARFPNGF